MSVMDDFTARGHGRESGPATYSDSNWAAYSSVEDRVNIALRRWVQGMEEALAKASIGKE